MGILKGVIEEEKHRLQELINYYQQEIAKLPAGSISWKKRYNKRYAYLARREKGKIKFEYMGAENSVAVNEVLVSVGKRKKLEDQLKEAKVNLAEVNGFLRERKK